MRVISLILLFTLCFLGAGRSASAENFVPINDQMKIDLDSVRSDANGRKIFVRESKLLGPEEVAVDCKNRAYYSQFKGKFYKQDSFEGIEKIFRLICATK